MISISTLFHVLQRNWLVAFLVSWVSIWYGRSVQCLRLVTQSFVHAEDVAVRLIHEVMMPSSGRRMNVAHLSPYGYWLG